MNNELQIVKEVPSVGEMLQGVIASGVTKENVEAIKEMVGLYERMQDREAEKEFAKAFVELQKEIPQVQATKGVPNNDGSIRYKFAPFEEIDYQVRAMCLRHGFTYHFSEGESKDGKLTKICTLQHTGGHKRSNPFSVRIGKGPPGCSESQADGSAHSYAKRGALCDALCIVVSHQDDDARNEGGTITPEQAEELARRVAETNSNRAAFLKLAGANDFASIPALKYDVLDQLLTRKERKQ